MVRILRKAIIPIHLHVHENFGYGRHGSFLTIGTLIMEAESGECVSSKKHVMISRKVEGV